MNDEKEQGDIWYFDTNVLHGLSGIEFDKLLLFCQQNPALIFYVSEIVVWESAWNYRERKDKFLDKNNLARFLAGFKVMIEKYNIHIIPITQDIYNKGNSLINDKNLYFFRKKSGNDKRDAYIFATALEILPKNSIIYTNEDKFQKILKKQSDCAFEIQNTENCKSFLENKCKPPQIKVYLDIISDQQIFETFSEHAHKIFCDYDNERYGEYEEQWKQAKNNLRLQEQEKIRSFKEPESIKSNRYELDNFLYDDKLLSVRILGYVGFFDTIEKQKLFILLKSCKHADSYINAGIKSLILKNFIIETPNYFIPNNHNIEFKKIFNQAMDSIMPELLEKLDLA